MTIALRTSNRAIGAFPNVPKFFNRYSLPIGLGFLNNPFGDDMISVAFEPGFITREFLEMSLSRPCTVFLQALTQGMVSLAVLFDCLTAKCFAFAIGSQIDNAQINPKGSIRSIRCWFWGVNGYSQVEGAIAVDQVGLSLDEIHASLLISSYLEGNQDTSRERQEGNRQQALKAHYPLIVYNRSFSTKVRFDALISLVHLSYLANGTNSQLSSKFISGTQFAIHQLLQLHLVRHLFGKCNIGNIGASGIEGVHGLKQGLMLFSCGCQLQEHRLFHTSSVADIEKIVSRQDFPTTPAPNKE